MSVELTTAVNDEDPPEMGGTEFCEFCYGESSACAATCHEMDPETVKFLQTIVDPNDLERNIDDARVELALERGVYYGLMREELHKYEKDVSWQRLRVVLIILTILSSITLLVAAIVVAHYMPRCPTRPTGIDWTVRNIIYEIHVPSYRVGKNCDTRSSGNVDGVYDLLKVPHNEVPSSRNYFLNNLYPVHIYWLRGLHPTAREIQNELSNELDPKLIGPDGKYLKDLYALARKKKRFILVDLLPYEYTNETVDLESLNCTFFADSSKNLETLNFLTKLEIRCFTADELRTRLTEFVNRYARYVNGFVLDYSRWLVRTAEGNKVLKELVQTLTNYDEPIAEHIFRKSFGKKFLFMRMPLLDSNFHESTEQRRIDEAAIESAGVRTVIETIDMISNSSCGSSKCLSKLVNEIQKPLARNISRQEESGGESSDSSNQSEEKHISLHRAFSIDDPLLKIRSLPEKSETPWTAVSLSAFLIAALPGSPVVYFGSELGMSHQSPLTQMRWRNGDNTCKEINDEPYCFCATFCDLNTQRPGTCPSNEAFPLYESYGADGHPAPVYEQVRAESNGPLKMITLLLHEKFNADTLQWGSANASLLSGQEKKNFPVLTVVRSSNERFADYALIIAFDSKGGNFQDHEFEDKCFKEVFHYPPSSSPKSQRYNTKRFNQMVIKANEVRLLKVTDCSGSGTMCRSSLVVFLFATAIRCLLS